jgi:hypothetical protein
MNPIAFFDLEINKLYKWTKFDGIVEFVFVISKSVIRNESFGSSYYDYHKIDFLTKTGRIETSFVKWDHKQSSFFGKEFIEIN